MCLQMTYKSQLCSFRIIYMYLMANFSINTNVNAGLQQWFRWYNTDVYDKKGAHYNGWRNKAIPW